MEFCGYRMYSPIFDPLNGYVLSLDSLLYTYIIQWNIKSLQKDLLLNSKRKLVESLQIVKRYLTSQALK